MQTIKHTITIANGATTSDEITDARELGSAASITIIAPAALTNAVKAEIGDATGGTFGTMQNPAGTDVALAAAKAVILPPFGGGSLRVKSAGAEAAARDFIVLIQVYR